MQAPRFMRSINRAFTNPVMRPLATRVAPLSLVHHRGRKSGTHYYTPVLAFPTDGGFVCPLPYGTDTDWCRNVVEAGGCSLKRAGRTVRVHNPRIVEANAALPLLPAPLRPGFRLAGLPGYLLLDRGTGKVRRRRSAQRR
jgi:deazaflavin-dependent oxidoreductase (nitroreductase family)